MTNDRLAGTILEFAGLDWQDAYPRGPGDLLARTTSDPLPLFATYATRRFERAVRTERHKFIQRYAPDGSVAGESLFDVAADPIEQKDIVQIRPDLAAGMRTLLLERVRRRSSVAGADAMLTQKGRFFGQDEPPLFHLPPEDDAGVIAARLAGLGYEPEPPAAIDQTGGVMRELQRWRAIADSLALP